MSPRRRRSSWLRRALVQLLVVAALFAGLEGVLRLAGFGPPPPEADPYVGFAGSRPLYVPGPDGLLETAPDRRNHFNLQRFAAEKPADTVRIVSLGGSTTYGRPYADETSFSGWLRHWLPHADPTHRWEVLNAGGVSYASYRVRRVLDELLAYAPDVVLLYTGHNEFLEERTYPGLSGGGGALGGLTGALRGTALFAAARELMGTAPETGRAPDAADGAADGDRTVLPEEVAPLLDSSVGLDAYTRDDALQEQVLRHFRENLGAMARAAREAGAVVVLVAPASELADCAPFKSEPDPGLSPEDGARLAELLALPVRTGDGGWRHDDGTLAALTEATGLSPRHALAWYRLGMALAAAGRTDEARAALERARDEDVVPLRALTEVRDLVRGVAAETGSLFVDGVAVLDAASAELGGRGLPGAELFLDHVHMTPDGYRRLAAALLGALAAEGVVTLDPAFTDARRAALDEELLAGLDTEDHVRALTRLAAVLDWAGKGEEAEALSDRALELGGGRDAMSHWLKGNALRGRGELEAAVDSYRAAVAIDEGYGEAWLNLTATLRQLGRRDEALAAARKTVALMKDDPRATFALGATLGEAGLTDDAESVWLRTLALDPAHADSLNALGLAAVRDGRVDEAEARFREATRVAPDEPRGHYNLGILLRAKDDTAGAEAAHRAALAVDPTYAPARIKLALLLAVTDRDAALALLDEGLALSPGDPKLLEAREQLPYFQF